jgi:hypothetical protein
MLDGVLKRFIGCSGSRCCGEKLFADAESFFKFIEKLKSCMTNECLTRKQLYNFDKTT